MKMKIKKQEKHKEKILTNEISENMNSKTNNTNSKTPFLNNDITQPERIILKMNTDNT